MKNTKSSLQMPFNLQMPFITGKVVSDIMFLDSSGLSMHHLAFQSKGFDGVNYLIYNIFQSKVRVTKQNTRYNCCCKLFPREITSSE